MRKLAHFSVELTRATQKTVENWMQFEYLNI